MSDPGENGRRGWISWLQRHDALWIAGVAVTLSLTYGVAIYWFLHRDDFLFDRNVPFVSALW